MVCKFFSGHSIRSARSILFRSGFYQYPDLRSTSHAPDNLTYEINPVQMHTGPFSQPTNSLSPNGSTCLVIFVALPKSTPCLSSSSHRGPILVIPRFCLVSGKQCWTFTSPSAQCHHQDCAERYLSAHIHSVTSLELCFLLVYVSTSMILNL